MSLKKAAYLFFLVFSSLLWGQQGPLGLFSNILQNQENNYTEKAYLHTDKPFYNSGETLWYKSYLTNAITHKPTAKSNVLYVDLINAKDSIVFDTKLFVKDGSFGTAGDILIDKQWETGNYQLRAYTNYMRNEDEAYIFRKPIYINQSKKKEKQAVVDVTAVPKFEKSSTSVNTPLFDIEDLQVNFYPEGGKLLSGFENTLGVKATNSVEEGVSLSGFIREKSSKNPVCYFKTFDFGLGKTSLPIEKGKSYEAVIIQNGQEKIFTLPETLIDGAKIAVVKKPETIDLQVLASTSLYNHFIIGHQRGKVIFQKNIDKSTLPNGIKLVTKKMPSGIVHFTLFDPAGKPLSERLVFVDNVASIKFDINATRFEKRSRVAYNLSQLPKNTESASVSVAVTSKETVPLNTGDNIKSWLLLNSDLRGEVPNTAVFFDAKKSTYQKEYLLESLMLTHGWRRFNWNQLVANSYKNQEKISPEKGVIISGQIFAKNALNKDKKIEANLFFLGKSSQIKTATISQKEKFKFGPFYVEDTLQTMLVGKLLGVKKKEEKEVVLLFDKGLPRPKIQPIPKSLTLDANPLRKAYKEKQAFFDDIDFTFSGENLLSETLLTVKKKSVDDVYDNILKERSANYSFPTHRLIIDSLPGIQGQTAIDLLRQIPGVQVNGSFPQYQVSIRGGNSASSGGFSGDPSQSIDGQGPFGIGPLFLLDGAISDISFVNNIQATDVSFIDVLSGADAAIYGGLGGDGVIAIYLKRGGSGNIVSTDKNVEGVANILTTPFYQAKEFFNKNYLKSKGDLYTPDYRSTLHWNPNWNITNTKDNTEVFYTSDETGIFQISVEGITNEGEIIQYIKEFEVVE